MKYLYIIFLFFSIQSFSQTQKVSM